MKNRKTLEGSITLLFIVTLVLFLNPFHFWMPTKIVMSLLCLFFILFLIFGSFVWNEKTKDEREQTHKMLASRIAFLVGSSILVLAIIVHEYHHSLDPWFVYALGGMILAKTISMWYLRKNH